MPLVVSQPAQQGDPFAAISQQRPDASAGSDLAGALANLLAGKQVGGAGSATADLSGGGAAPSSGQNVDLLNFLTQLFGQQPGTPQSVSQLDFGPGGSVPPGGQPAPNTALGPLASTTPIQNAPITQQTAASAQQTAAQGARPNELQADPFAQGPVESGLGTARNALSAGRAGVSIANEAGLIPGNIAGIAGPALGAAGAALGLGTGAYELAQGNPAGVGPLASGVAGGLSATGSIAGTGALGPTMAAAAPMLSGLGTVAAPIAAVIALGMMNWQHQEQKAIENQTQESGTIRKEFVNAVPNIRTASELANQLVNLRNLSPDQQQQFLRSVLPAFERGIAAMGPISRFINTRGQGGDASLTRPADTTEASNLYARGGQDTLLGYIQAADQAARMGIPVEQIPGQNRDPAAIINQLAGGTFDPYSANIDYSQAVPGNLTNFVNQILAANMPGFAGSELAGRFSSMPEQVGTPVNPEAIAATNSARAATAAAQVTNALASGPYSNDLNAIAYAAPYAGGAEAALRGLIPSGMNTMRGEQIIRDELARGNSPVGISNVLQQAFEYNRGGGF